MTVLVSDVSVLIDLEHGSLLETAFRLPCIRIVRFLRISYVKNS